MRDAGQRQSYKYQAVGAAEYWRGHLQELQGARREKALAGKVATQAPRGYEPNRTVDRRHPDRDRPIPCDPDAGFIRSVAGVLEAGGMRAFFLKPSPLVWPDGKPLAFSTMQRLLAKPVYRGTFQWGDIVLPNARKALIPPEQAALDEATKGLKALERQAAPTPHVDAELSAYLELQADPAHLASLRGPWDDEPIQWRRAFVRRFVRGAEVRKGKSGRLAIAVTWADGVTTEHAAQSLAPSLKRPGPAFAGPGL